MSPFRLARMGAAVLLAAALASPAAAAPVCGEPPANPGPGMTVLRSPADAAKLPAGAPLVAWIGPTADQTSPEPAEWSAAALRRLPLAPGSVIADIQVPNGPLAGWAARGVYFSRVGLPGAALAGADLSEACFDHANLESADFSGAKLNRTSFSGSDLAGARFDGASLVEAKLDCLPGIVGEGCYGGGERLSFRGAALRGADIAQPLQVHGGTLEGAELERTVVALSDTILDQLAAARVASVVMVAGAPRSGTAETFQAEELARLRQLSGGRLTSLIRERGAQPAFDCGTAKLTVIEQRLCQGGDLAALDQLMSLSYRRRLDRATDRAEVQAAQVGFLKRRNACAAAPAAALFTCVFDAYVERLGALGRDFAAVVAPPALRHLEARPALAAAAVKTDPLTVRLLRVYGRSPDTATLESRGGALALTAGSLGGNGHSCNFEGELSWNATKGTWVGGAEAPMSWLVLPDGIALTSPPEDSRAFCGARASWPAVYFLSAPQP